MRYFSALGNGSSWVLQGGSNGRWIWLSVAFRAFSPVPPRSQKHSAEYPGPNLVSEVWFVHFVLVSFYEQREFVVICRAVGNLPLNVDPSLLVEMTRFLLERQYARSKAVGEGFSLSLKAWTGHGPPARNKPC